LSNADFSEIIKGLSSLGGIIKYDACCKPVEYSFRTWPNIENYSSVPSKYNKGKNTIYKYSTINNIGTKINSIDLSSPFENFRDNEFAISAFGVILERSIKTFYEGLTNIKIY
jgi:hypothetical protein